MTTNDDAQRGHDPVCGCGHFASEHWDEIHGAGCAVCDPSGGLGDDECYESTESVYGSHIAALRAEIQRLSVLVTRRK